MICRRGGSIGQKRVERSSAFPAAPPAAMLIQILQISLLPIVATCSIASLVTCGQERRSIAEAQFFASLLFAILMTTMTVAHADDCWLVHTVTVAAMVLGALVLPRRCATMSTCPIQRHLSNLTH